MKEHFWEPAWDNGNQATLRVPTVTSVSEGIRRRPVGHRSHSVQHIGEVLEEVDAVQSAGTGHGVEDCAAPGSGVAAEELGVLPGEGDVAVDTLDEVVVPSVVSARGDGFDAIPLVQDIRDFGGCLSVCACTRRRAWVQGSKLDTQLSSLMKQEEAGNTLKAYGMVWIWKYPVKIVHQTASRRDCCMLLQNRDVK